MSEKYLIVGVDPGTSVGLAFLDVDGNVVKIISGKNLSIDDCIMEIAAAGSAAVVASDKATVPPFVNKVASILGARLFTPDTDLLVEKKRELARDTKTENDHERDSLAAAKYAYYHFQNKIRRIEKQIDEEMEKTKARVLKGEKVADMFAPSKEKCGQEEQLKAQIAALRKENRNLHEEIKALERAKPRSPHSILREAAKEARELMILVSKGKLVPLKEVPSLNYLDLKSIPVKHGDFILCRSKGNDGKGLRFLESRRVGGIISPVKIDSLAPTCYVEDIEILCWEGLFFSDPIEISKKCGKRKEVDSRDMHDLLVDYKKGRR